MSDGKRERKIREAREAADLLERSGAIVQANAVRALCRAHISLAETATRLWHDNAELRRVHVDPDPGI